MLWRPWWAGCRRAEVVVEVVGPPHHPGRDVRNRDHLPQQGRGEITKREVQMDVESFCLSDGYEVIHRDGEVIAIIRDGHSVELREDGWATIELLAAVKELCRRRGWPEDAISQLELSVLHWNAPRVRGVGGPGLWGRVPYWGETTD